MEVKIKKISEGVTTPKKGSDKAAGYDLYACIGNESYIIPPRETAKIGTGVAVEIPDGYWGGIFARSGLATKQGLRPANCVGVIDSDYRGEVIVALFNDSDEPRIIHNGDRIAQFIIMPYLQFNIKVINELSKTERGEGGFGSTGGFTHSIDEAMK